MIQTDESGNQRWTDGGDERVTLSSSALTPTQLRFGPPQAAKKKKKWRKREEVKKDQYFKHLQRTWTIRRQTQ